MWERLFEGKQGLKGIGGFYRGNDIVRGSASWSIRAYGVYLAKHVRDMSVTLQGVVWSEVLAFK